jgi:hypothetical protein
MRSFANNWTIIFVMVFSIAGISFAQNPVSQNLKLIGATEYKNSELITGESIGQKIMACAGNAANDNWANAQNIVVNAAALTNQTTCGSTEAGETNACNNAGGTTVWFKFTATATTQYVSIIYVSGACYFGSAVYEGATLPTSSCPDREISCQSSSAGPLNQIYQLTNLTISNVYYIQVYYPSGGACGSNGTFNIQVTTANPGGFISNPQYINTCATVQPGCFFNSPPSVNTVTSSCTSYPLAANGYSANSVFTVYQTFNSSPSWSNFSWQAIITSNCLGGNVVWLRWTLYNCSCGILTCGDINTLTGSGLACGTCYILKYQFELANCTSFTTVWPYQNVPPSPTPCTVLPIELLYFTAEMDNDKFVNLDWETAAEINIDKYILQRSSDGATFKELVRTEAIAKTGGAKYAYRDNEKLDNGTYYYKLSAIEKDGSSHFEKIVAVTIEDGKEIIRFAPNPAQNNFEIIFGKSTLNVDTKMEIYNSYGERVSEENFIPTQNIKPVDISNLRPGLYYVNIITPASSTIIKQTLIIK